MNNSPKRFFAVAVAGAFIMAAAIVYALVIGSFFAEARTMFPLPWFHLSMIDLYAGFLLICAWIAFREQARTTAVLWIILILTLGNFASFLYILRAIAQSQGDWSRFWLGTSPKHGQAA